MFKEAKRFVTRKFKKSTYEHTHLPEGYESISEEYRQARGSLDDLSSAVKDLRNYEHGGKLLKNVTKLTNSLSSSTKIKALHRDDIFTGLAVVASHLAQSSAPHSDMSVVGTNVSKALFDIAEAKAQMNQNLDGILVSLETLRKDSKKLDSKRRHVDDLRLKLEEMIQEGNITADNKNKQEAEFNFEAGEVLVKMRDFTGKKGLAGILNQVLGIYNEFVKREGKSLSVEK